jgi:hypothetical protein
LFLRINQTFIVSFESMTKQNYAPFHGDSRSVFAGIATTTTTSTTSTTTTTTCIARQPGLL